MWRLASETVDINSPYSYLMLGEYFAENCAVAEQDDELVGFVTGFRPFEDPETLFIWQIAVDESVRGHGVASRMLDDVTGRPRVPRLRYLEATVTPGNEASKKLFRAFAERWKAEYHEEELFSRSDFPRDANGSHDPEIRFRIGAF